MKGALRPGLLWSGLLGLALGTLLAALATWLVSSHVIRPLWPQPIVVLLMALILAGVSVAEVPLMVFAMRRLVAEQRGNHLLVLGLNTSYVLFAGVYALPVFLLTGNRPGGWLLWCLGLVRLATSLLLVPPRGSLTPGDPPNRDPAHQREGVQGAGATDRAHSLRTPSAGQGKGT